MSEPTPFQVGDKVVVNRGTVGTVLVYDVDTDVLVVESKAGSSTDRATYSLSQTKLEHLVSDVATSDVRPGSDAPAEPADEESATEADAEASK